MMVVGPEIVMNLFSPINLGAITLVNRIVAASMMRNGSGADGVPTMADAEYYEQRASAGLIVTATAQVAPEGHAYPGVSGIYSPAQTAGWQRVADRIHRHRGRVFLQLGHGGRVSHPLLQPDGSSLPVAPSPVAARGDAITPQGPRPFVTPRPLETWEIAHLVERFRDGAIHALDAGFDGVEIYAANGYLLDQFLRDGTNRRTDRYGGDFANRTRFLMEVVEAVSAVCGSERVGVRLSPNGSFNDMWDSDPVGLFCHVARTLKGFGLAYLHVVEPLPQDRVSVDGLRLARHLKPIFRGPVIANGGYDRQRAFDAVARGDSDMVSFGVMFRDNPDLASRLQRQVIVKGPEFNAGYRYY
jgi:N-ethylmaleimide reductase